MKGNGVNRGLSYRIFCGMMLVVVFSAVSLAQVKEQHSVSLRLSDFDTTSRARVSSECYPCLSGNFWGDVKHSVVRIVTFRESETIICTGTLVNNTAQDGKPYILTANHCLSSQDDVDHAVFTFGYDDMNCDGIPFSPGSSMFGGTLRATSYEHDFTLVELEHHVPLAFHPYFAGWDVTGQRSDMVSCIHHPQAGGKRISLENDYVESTSYHVDGLAPRAPEAFWKVKQWDIGFTEGGSSGAPLFDQRHRVIGTLSGGMSKCGALYNDYFQKLSRSWNAVESPHHQLKSWLDPISSGVSVMDGFDPAAGTDVRCDTVTNIISGEATRTLMFEDGGYIGGCNNHGITAFAEELNSIDSAMLTGVNLYLGAIESEATTGLVVSVHSEDDGVPGRLLAQKYVPYSQLKLFSNYIEFYPVVAVAGKFFVSFSPECSSTNQFAMEQAEWRTSSYSTAWAKQGSVWLPMTALNDQGFGSSFYVEAMTCMFQNSAPPGENIPRMNLFPNPASSQLVCSIESNASSHYQVTVFNSRGQREQVAVDAYSNDMIVDVSSLDAGVYILVVTSFEKVYCEKFLKR